MVLLNLFLQIAERGVREIVRRLECCVRKPRPKTAGKLKRENTGVASAYASVVGRSERKIAVEIV